MNADKYWVVEFSISAKLEMKPKWMESQQLVFVLLG